MKSIQIFSLVLALVCISNAHALDSKESMVGIDPSAIDSSVDPCNDFYHYACGNWIKKTKLPSDKPSLYRSFTEISDRNLDLLHEVLEKDAKNASKETDVETKKLGDFYASCMNESAIEKDSPLALAKELSAIDQLKDKSDLGSVLADLHLKGISAFFSFGQETDLVDPTIKIAAIAQGGMGLPDSTYYTGTDAAKAAIRKAYVAHLEKMWTLLGKKDAEAKTLAAQVFSIEDALAKVALTPEESQDPTVLYHPVVAADLKTATPLFTWDTYFKGLGISTPKKIDLTEAKFLAAVQTSIGTLDLEAIRNYLRLRMVDTYAPFLGKKFYNEWFQFYGVKLTGQKVPEAHWKRCVQGIGKRQGMGEALGKAFVEKTFSPAAKAKTLEMINNIRKALNEDLAHLDWLDSATRAKALEKLEKITLKIGYPDHWKDYSDLKISKDSFLNNVINSIVFTEKEEMNKIGGPVDPSLWDMEPHDVNAYYAPDLNQINFPAGILQAPFFSEKYSDPANYGAIGVVIGHEITHGFDTVGSKFDGRGMMSDWWTAKVKAQFAEKASCMKKEYSSFEALPGLHVNGDLTITENIADNGGLKISYAAYKLSTQGKPATPNQGKFNADQQFFMSMAQSWCAKSSDEHLRKQVSSDPHSPAMFRINGSFMNSPDFATAFSCAAKKPMAPENRCFIW